MSTMDSEGDPTPPRPGEVSTHASENGAQEQQQQRSTDPTARPGSPDPLAPPKHRTAWIWVSAILALAVVGLLIWQFNTQSELDDAQAQVKDLQAQIDQGKTSGSTAAASYKSAYADLEQELGSAQADLSATEKELASAQDAAQQAQNDAATAKQQADQAQSATQKAQAEADQASADAKAAESSVTITKDCANAFLSQVAAVIESADPTAAAEAAKQELQSIAEECKTALGRT